MDMSDNQVLKKRTSITTTFFTDQNPISNKIPNRQKP
ncbi:hypothetical protein COLO4_27416 [Corchorus olitorius]|uniref:Uncharacterized protein n=1 Tax=Corchorus olitorius TaxID=93759 RepID=A0A1R3HR54_9ROSI|nr:hypothetical protein COLO4_27416 [Corchorus olitorius]